MTRTAWTVDEVDGQLIEVLPRKETLLFDVNITNIVGINLAIAVNAASIGASASAIAYQSITGIQH